MQLQTEWAVQGRMGTSRRSEPAPRWMLLKGSWAKLDDTLAFCKPPSKISRTGMGKDRTGQGHATSRDTQEIGAELLQGSSSRSQSILCFPSQYPNSELMSTNPQGPYLVICLHWEILLIKHGGLTGIVQTSLMSKPQECTPCPRCPITPQGRVEQGTHLPAPPL